MNTDPDFTKEEWEKAAQQAGFAEGGNEFKHGWIDHNGDIHPTAQAACEAHGIRPQK